MTGGTAMADPIAQNPRGPLTPPITPGLSGFVARSTAELAQVRPDWEALRARVAAAGGIVSSNADPDRFAATAATLGPGIEPYVVAMRDASGARAMLVARRVRRGIPVRIGYLRARTPPLRCLEVVYGGLLTDGTDAARRALSDHLRVLLGSGEIQHVLVNHVPLADPLMPLLTDLGSGALVRGVPEPHWVVALTPGSFEKTMSRHSAKHRSKLRRYDRLLCEAFGDDVRLDVFTTESDAPRFLSSVTPVAERTYQDELGAAVKDTPRWRAVLATEARMGRMRSYVLMAGGRAIAYQNGSVYGKRYLCDGRGYLPEHRELRPGNVLSLRIMADLCEQGQEWVDYGFGDAEYKRVYASDHWEEASLHLYGRGWRATLASLMDRGSLAASRLFRSAGLASRIKRLWRRRLSGAPGPGPRPEPEERHKHE